MHLLCHSTRNTGKEKKRRKLTEVFQVFGNTNKTQFFFLKKKQTL